MCRDTSQSRDESLEGGSRDKAGAAGGTGGAGQGRRGGAQRGAAPGSPSQAPRPAPCPLAHQGPGTHATVAATWPHPRAPRLAPPLPRRKASSTGRHTGSLGKAWPPGTKTRPPHACGHDPPPRAGSSVHVTGLHVCVCLRRQVSPAVCVGAACVHSVGACTLHACACARSTHRGHMGVCVCVCVCGMASGFPGCVNSSPRLVAPHLPVSRPPTPAGPGSTGRGWWGLGEGQVGLCGALSPSSLPGGGSSLCLGAMGCRRDPPLDGPMTLGSGTLHPTLCETVAGGLAKGTAWTRMWPGRRHPHPGPPSPEGSEPGSPGSCVPGCSQGQGRERQMLSSAADKRRGPW